MTDKILERGPWACFVDSATNIVCQSGDFTYDVRIAANGDFGDRQTVLEYAEWLEKALNLASGRTA